MPTAKQFIAELRPLRTEAQLKAYRRSFRHDPADEMLGVPMGEVFALAKTHAMMSLDEIEALLDSPIHEARVGAVSIMDFQARDKKTSTAQRKALFELYVRRHDRINNWDLVDRSAPYVVGGYLFDKSRKPLYKLARSRSESERRTAIVSTAYFIRNGDLDDTFKIAEMLLADEHDLVQKATGWMLRAAGDVDRARLVRFLDAHAAVMPRATLRAAIEKFDKKLRDQYYSATRTNMG